MSAASLLVVPAPAIRAAERTTDQKWAALAAVLAAHAAAGLLMYAVPAFTTLHALGTVLAGLAISVSARRSGTVLMAVAYVVGSEVVWRMCGAFVFHEMAKYSICAMFGIALARRKGLRIDGRALLYLALLTPSLVAPFFTFDLDGFRRAVSFNLSGPLTLAIAVTFCSNARVNGRELYGIAPVLAAPLAGVAAITLFTTYTARAIRFSTESNFLTSGGFGPNQVSSSLALGVLVLLMYLICGTASPARRMLLFGLVLIFAMQSAMTFSRGGMLSVTIALLFVAPLAFQSRRSRLAFAGLALGIAASALVIYPRLNRFTGGKLGARFSEMAVTGRESIARQDLALWQSAPVFGVGVGLSKFGHAGFRAAHTEISRCLAEHGLLGLIAIGILLSIGVQPFLFARQDAGTARTFLCAMAAWSVLYLTVNAMRMAAPALAFGLAALRIPPPE